MSVRLSNKAKIVLFISKIFTPKIICSVDSLMLILHPIFCSISSPHNINPTNVARNNSVIEWFLKYLISQFQLDTLLSLKFYGIWECELENIWKQLLLTYSQSLVGETEERKNEEEASIRTFCLSLSSFKIRTSRLLRNNFPQKETK